MRDLFETTLRDVSVRTSIRLEKCYLKHGTSIAVRLFVIDKVVGGAIPVPIQRASIRELLGALTVPERSAITTVSPPAPNRSSGLSLFRAVRSTPPAPRPFPAPAPTILLPAGPTPPHHPAPFPPQT